VTKLQEPRSQLDLHRGQTIIQMRGLCLWWPTDPQTILRSFTIALGMARQVLVFVDSTLVECLFSVTLLHG
jgi:hypothetical protein